MCMSKLWGISPPAVVVVVTMLLIEDKEEHRVQLFTPSMLSTLVEAHYRLVLCFCHYTKTSHSVRLLMSRLLNRFRFGNE